MSKPIFSPTRIGNAITGPVVSPSANDAVQLLITLRQAIQTLFDALAKAPAQHQEAAQRKLLLALELRLKVEQSVVLPGLAQGAAANDARLAGCEKDISQLRGLMDLARDPSLTSLVRRTVIGALDGVAALHFERMERLLAHAKRNRQIDAAALGMEMQALLDRWHTEVLATGDIEDEEMDPVGSPPR